jgi:hypothetical protein
MLHVGIFLYFSDKDDSDLNSTSSTENNSILVMENFSRSGWRINTFSMSEFFFQHLWWENSSSKSKNFDGRLKFRWNYLQCSIYRLSLSFSLFTTCSVSMDNIMVWASSKIIVLGAGSLRRKDGVRIGCILGLKSQEYITRRGCAQDCPLYSLLLFHKESTQC